jgi:hypothetical protein
MAALLLHLVLLAWASGGAAAAGTWPADFPSLLDLADLDGWNGITYTSPVAKQGVGNAVAAAGDCNGDGFQDWLIGSYSDQGSDPTSSASRGVAWLVFGTGTSRQANPAVNLLSGSFEDGTLGVSFGATALEGDYLGFDVAGVGDMNGDGIDDIALGSIGSDSGAGAVYVIFGRTEWPAAISLPPALGEGFSVHGFAPDSSLGHSISTAGDVNGDGFADMIIGSPESDGPHGSFSGEAYVIFGSANPSGIIVASNLSGGKGFVILGVDSFHFTGISVAGGGNVNGDLFDDILVGAHMGDGNGLQDNGIAYLILGEQNIGGADGVLDLRDVEADSTLGVVIYGGSAADLAASSVSWLGDVNNDGIDDFCFGAPRSDSYKGDIAAGTVYVIFGNSDFGSSDAPRIDVDVNTLSNGNLGFIIDGPSADAEAGTSVAAAGDLNGDGFADILIGASGDPGAPGLAYVVMGKANFGAEPFLLSEVNGANGFALRGIEVGAAAGFDVCSIGDEDGDGAPDLLIASPLAGVGGEVYVVYTGHVGVEVPPTPAPTPAPTASGCTALQGACTIAEDCCSGVCDVDTCAASAGGGGAPTPTPTDPPTILQSLTGRVVQGSEGDPPAAFDGSHIDKFFAARDDLRGAVTLSLGQDANETTSIQVSVASVEETDASGRPVGATSDPAHGFLGAALPFEVSPDGPQYMSLDGLRAVGLSVTANLPLSPASIAIYYYIFLEEGSVLNGADGEEEIHVSPGTLKVSYVVKDWPWCQPGGSGSTLCLNHNGDEEEGAFLNLTLDVTQPAEGQRRKLLTRRLPSLSGGIHVDLSNSIVAAELVLSEYVYAEDYGWSEANVVTSGNQYTVKMPRSSGIMFYDPTVALDELLNGGGGTPAPSSAPPITEEEVKTWMEEMLSSFSADDDIAMATFVGVGVFGGVVGAGLVALCAFMCFGCPKRRSTVMPAGAESSKGEKTGLLGKMGKYFACFGLATKRSTGGKSVSGGGSASPSRAPVADGAKKGTLLTSMRAKASDLRRGRAFHKIKDKESVSPKPSRPRSPPRLNIPSVSVMAARLKSPRSPGGSKITKSQSTRSPKSPSKLNSPRSMKLPSPRGLKLSSPRNFLRSKQKNGGALTAEKVSLDIERGPDVATDASAAPDWIKMAAGGGGASAAANLGAYSSGGNNGGGGGSMDWITAAATAPPPARNITAPRTANPSPMSSPSPWGGDQISSSVGSYMAADVASSAPPPSSGGGMDWINSAATVSTSNAMGGPFGDGAFGSPDTGPFGAPAGGPFGV